MNKETIQLKQKKGIPAWSAILLFFLLFFTFLVISEEITIYLAPIIDTKGVTLNSDINLLMLNSGLILVSTFIVVTIMQCLIERQPWSQLGLSLKRIKFYVIMGILLPLVIYIIGFTLCYCTNAISIVSINFYSIDFCYSFILFTMVAFTEELIGRGYILGCLLRTKLNPWTSIFISSFIFSAMHFTNSSIGIISILNLIIAGILFGTCFFYTKNLFFPILLHLFWNWLQGPILGFKVSGNALTNSVFNLELNKNTLLNGGEFGFEGSIFCTILLIITIIGIIIFFKKRFSYASKNQI